MSDTVTTLADNLQRLVDATDAIGNAIIAKGGNVSQYDRLEQYPDDIITIPNTITQSGTIPISFISNGSNLVDWIIYGNSEGVGEYDSETGKYIIPIICGNTTTNIYINSPLYENQSVNFKDNKTIIPTIDGINTLDTSLTNKPSKINIAYNTNNGILVATNTSEGTSSITFNSINGYLIDYSINGNMVQNGTPTPTNPIQPSETGDMTGNLFDKSTLVDGKGLDANGAIINYPRRCTTSVPINVSEFDDVTISFASDVSNTRVIYALFNSSTLIRRESAILSGSSIDVSSGNSLYICFYETTDLVTVTSDDLSNIMFNSGSTAISYEPYGYKIPVSSADTITPVYLGDVQTTRKIKKLVLTGDENIDKNTQSASDYIYYFSRSYLVGRGDVLDVKCTHLVQILTPGANAVGINTTTNQNVIYINFGSTIMNAQPSGNTIAGLKEYLASQYAAGTPVTIWYVLATEATGIVNEPLRKIGNYTDTISSINNTTPQIPTIKGTNILTVNTALEPSNIKISYYTNTEIIQLNEKVINENGTYLSTTNNLNGYSAVTVDVPVPTYINDTLESVNNSLEESIGSNI